MLAADLSNPVVTFSNITPLSMQVNWGRINYDVDSWDVTIRQAVEVHSDTELSDLNIYSRVR